MKLLSALTFATLGLSVILTGCSSATRPDNIVTTVAELKPGTAGQVMLTLRFTSESLNAFGFSNSTHKLYLNGTYVGRATCSTPVGLPPLSTATQDVVLTVENAALLRQLSSQPGEATVRYRLETVLNSATEDTELHLRASADGTVDLGKLR